MIRPRRGPLFARPRRRRMPLSTTVAQPSGLSRRDFVKVCTAAAAAVGMPAWAGEKMAEKVAKGHKPSVVWLHFQECTGCTESLLRASHPDAAALILDLISLDYHETLAAAAGKQMEASLDDAVKRGGYVLVVEGASPEKEGGIYCQVAGKTALDTLRRVADKAAAVIAIGSCASWGGVPSADPNPTGATGVPMILKDKKVVTLPALDAKGRPMFAYGRVIHEDCPRRPHFDAGRFAQAYGDPGHRDGHCLYKLGCKGPQTHANCSLLSFCEMPGAWPIGIGHPCVGCTEQEIAFRVPMHTTVPIDKPTAPMAYPGIAPEQGTVSAIAAGVAGLVVGGAAGAGWLTSRKLAQDDKTEEQQERKE